MIIPISFKLNEQSTVIKRNKIKITKIITTMLSKKMEKALNAQINAEFWSAYLYLSMSAYFEAEGKSGFANWFKVQFKEEQAHAEIFMNFV